ncbi:hypothetical protein EYZ11_006893 [Aspergillus tanneri]|uniref:Uncharacterized protein n=1 Tax=Aspergillus tanneri TaxID=1220188 RepID=A0A4S3JED0_9EURO|nr:hypothetical protein EYZ11_006893 [Aspergillus tanneri]
MAPKFSPTLKLQALVYVLGPSHYPFITMTLTILVEGSYHRDLFLEHKGDIHKNRYR